MDTILVVDDETSIRTMLREYLTERGYRVETAPDGRNALFVARESSPDLILLDIMMPEMDGYTFIHNLRKEAQTPVILLTAKLDESDKVAGFELGADDYVTKPFGLKELDARIRAVLRRSRQSAGPTEVLRALDVVLDRAKRSVEVAGDAVTLTTTEFELLATLMQSPGRVFSRTALLEQLHSHGIDGVARTVDVHVRNLRVKIEKDSHQPRYIQTVYGAGYRFASE